VKSSKVYNKQLGREFYIYRADKHLAVCNNTQTASSMAAPGDYVVLDSFFNVMVFDRKQFQKVFGSKEMDKLD
jgi:hypothetical protein